MVAGNVMDAASSKAVIGATATIALMADSSITQNFVTDENGEFLFEDLAFGYYRLQVKML